MKTKKHQTVKVCQIGAGLIGCERISAMIEIANSGIDAKLCAIYDPYLKEIPNIISRNNLKLVDSLEKIYIENPDWVFISTPHDISVALVKDMLSRGYNVLVEKPLGRNVLETKEILSYQVRKKQLYVGFNYRFYDCIHSALIDMRHKAFGNIISINLVLGHGGNPKDKDGWKLNHEKAGGGVLIDPGIHLFDLCRCMFDNKIDVKDALTWKGSWDTGIEEEAHILMQSVKSIVNLQISIVKWRSTFRIEINGDLGYGIIEGRGKSYGQQSYRKGNKWGWMSDKSQKESEIIVNETDGNNSFMNEILALLSVDDKCIIHPCSGEEALEDMKLVDSCRQLAGI